MATDPMADLISISGLVITVLGFAATMYGIRIAIEQLKKTQGAVEAGELETKKLRARLAATGSSNYVTGAEARIRSAKRELELSNWPDAVEELSELRNTLLVLYDRKVHFDEGLRSEIPPYTSDIADYIQYLALPGKTGVNAKRVEQIRQRLRELSGLTMKLAHHLAEKV